MVTGRETDPATIQAPAASGWRGSEAGCDTFRTFCSRCGGGDRLITAGRARLGLERGPLAN
jgi:hypothetical protein